MKTITAILMTAVLMIGCASLPESNEAAVETAWELSYQLQDIETSTVAIVDFDATDVPEALHSSYRNDLGTHLAIAFRESDLNHRVVTRDKVDAVFAEQSIELQGLTVQDARIRIGQVLGADILVTGTVFWLEDDLYRASPQLIEVDTGVILGGASWDFWYDTESGR